VPDGGVCVGPRSHGCCYLTDPDYRGTSQRIVAVIANGYNSHTKKASISELKDKLSALIDGVQRGAPLLIVDRGRPVARLEPVSGPIKGVDPEGQLARLERAGVLRRGRRALAPEFLKRELPRAVRGSSAVAALLEERREGR